METTLETKAPSSLAYRCIRCKSARTETRNLDHGMEARYACGSRLVLHISHETKPKLWPTWKVVCEKSVSRG